MAGTAQSVYCDISERTNGAIYLGVVGPVRTGKSTFVKRVMETLVIPNIENVYQRERAKDELPQSCSGRTIMTSEPKFVPEDDIQISPDNAAMLSVRLIDSVGYMVPGALGAEENGKPRMVTTPWAAEEIPMSEAAEIGTKRIMDEHCSIGIVITTDASIHDIPREDFIDAERRAITDMRATGKPFIVLLNSADPLSPKAQQLKEEIEKEHNVCCLAVNCLTLDSEEIIAIIKQLLYEFPTTQIRFILPSWLCALPATHILKDELFQAIYQLSDSIETISSAEKAISQLKELRTVKSISITEVNLGAGDIICEIMLENSLYFEILSEFSNQKIENDTDLIKILKELSVVKTTYDKVSAALQSVQSTGYGIVMPSPEEMHLESPQIVRKGSNYGVRLKASAPSIHMMRADIQTEISPIVGDEKQSEELLSYLLQEYEDNTEKLWDSNIFGKSVYELVKEGLSSKLKRMPDEARFKLQSTLTRIINENCNGLICILLA